MIIFGPLFDRVFGQIKADFGEFGVQKVVQKGSISGSRGSRCGQKGGPKMHRFWHFWPDLFSPVWRKRPTMHVCLKKVDKKWPQKWSKRATFFVEIGKKPWKRGQKMDKKGVIFWPKSVKKWSIFWDFSVWIWLIFAFGGSKKWIKKWSKSGQKGWFLMSFWTQTVYHCTRFLTCFFEILVTRVIGFGHFGQERQYV